MSRWVKATHYAGVKLINNNGAMPNNTMALYVRLGISVVRNSQTL